MTSAAEVRAYKSEHPFASSDRIGEVLHMRPAKVRSILARPARPVRTSHPARLPRKPSPARASVSDATYRRVMAARAELQLRGERVSCRTVAALAGCARTTVNNVMRLEASGGVVTGTIHPAARAVVASALREWRESAGLSQGRVAMRMGSPRTLVSRIERGSRGGQLETCQRFARACGRTDAELDAVIASALAQEGRAA